MNNHNQEISEPNFKQDYDELDRVLDMANQTAGVFEHRLFLTSLKMVARNLDPVSLLQLKDFAQAIYGDPDEDAKSDVQRAVSF